MVWGGDRESTWMCYLWGNGVSCRACVFGEGREHAERIVAFTHIVAFTLNLAFTLIGACTVIIAKFLSFVLCSERFSPSVQADVHFRLFVVRPCHDTPTATELSVLCFLRRHVSFVDCPGHDILMATMLNGAAVMDAALLLIAGNETCPQPQTAEHLAAVEIMKLQNIIILQNKIDLVKEQAALQQVRKILTSFFRRGLGY